MAAAVEANLVRRASAECHRGVQAFLDKEELDWRRLGSTDA
jgi:hypothetical protein